MSFIFLRVLMGRTFLLVMVFSLVAPNYVIAQANASASNGADAAGQAACRALVNLTNLTILQAEIRNLKDSGTPYCYVRGIISPAIGFHVQLPLPGNWKGRFLMEGDSAFDGALQFADNRVAQGYAVANTNMGHDAGAEPEAEFAWQNPQAKIDFAFRAVHVSVNAAKALVKNYYGQAAKYSYFEGCSTGGREALVEVQRYPKDFDGVVAGDPVNRWIQNNMTHMWILQKVYRGNFAAALAFDTDGDGKLDSITKANLLRDAVMAKCDALDGIKDGIIDDPTKCKFIPEVELASKMCPGDVNADGCFTKAQMQFIKDLYRGPYDSKGAQVDWGKPFGWEGVELVNRYIPYKGNNFKPMTLSGMDRQNFFFYDEDPGVPPPDLADLSYKPNKTKNPPDWVWWQWNIDDWTAGKAKKMHALLDAVDSDLTQYFVGNNGRLLVYHGWADGGPAPQGSVDYYKNIVSTTFKGNQKAAEERFRLFMAPGMGHCTGGPGPNEWDKLSPMVDWVENGKAPDSLVAVHREAGKVTNERPLCPYPQHATYIGPAGGENSQPNWVAKNFTCR